MKALRRWLGYRVWDLASWLYPYAPSDPDEVTEQGWELNFYFESTEKTADEVWERLSDSICDSDHHALDPCPGPQFVAGMHPLGWSLNHLDAQGLAEDLRGALGAVAEAVSAAPSVTQRIEMAGAVARDKVAAYDHAVAEAL